MSAVDHDELPGPAIDVDAIAADFVIRRRDLTLWTADDEVGLNAWLSQSLAHETAYWRIESIWGRADRLNALRPLSPHTPETLPHRRRSLIFGVAAVLAAVATIGATATLLFPHESTITFATPVGGRETVRLGDGSQIVLNTNTVLRTTISTTRRTAELVTGEAFFQIKHDPVHPFVVVVGGHRVTDLGTKFRIRADKGRLTVSLLEGEARVDTNNGNSDAKSALLTPGDEAVATTRDLSVTRKSHKDLDSEMSWRRGVLEFHRATLVEVATEFNRYNNRKIVIADAAAGARIINATLQTNDVGAFARMAREFLGLDVEERRNEILISH